MDQLDEEFFKQHKNMTFEDYQIKQRCQETIGTQRMHGLILQNHDECNGPCGQKQVLSNALDLFKLVLWDNSIEEVTMDFEEHLTQRLANEVLRITDEEELTKVEYHRYNCLDMIMKCDDESVFNRGYGLTPLINALQWVHNEKLLPSTNANAFTQIRCLWCIMYLIMMDKYLLYKCA